LVSRTAPSGAGDASCSYEMFRSPTTKLVKLKDNPLAEGNISVKRVEKTKGRNGTGSFPMREVEIVVLQCLGIRKIAEFFMLIRAFISVSVTLICMAMNLFPTTACT